MELNYLVVGAGATGGVISAYLSRAGKKVSIIARGESYRVINEKGIKVLTPHDNPYADKARPTFPNHSRLVYPPQEDIVEHVKAYTEEEYNETPDVVFVCVKDYSLPQMYPFLDRVCGSNTIVIPIQNSLNTGERLAEVLTKKPMIAPGVAYVAVMRMEPGVIKQKLNFYTIVFGRLDCGKPTPEMEQVCADLIDGGIDAMLTENPLQAGIRKFFRVSIGSALMCAFNVNSGGIAANPECRKLFVMMGNELKQIAEAIGAPFTDHPDPLTEAVFAAWECMPDYRTSMKLDFDNGKSPEYQSQIFDVIELGRKYGVDMKGYYTVAKMLGYDK
ncbi:MAG: 2-dehydropantoate 2-reductase N-terminal domain-containing protein [Lachnospiraceae bacterium]|nr:2-dehydropantoate 2-reductase N-terminal domain-containing protein [Lachnospiraceae bacterium]